MKFHSEISLLKATLIVTQPYTYSGTAVIVQLMWVNWVKKLIVGLKT